MSQGDKTMSEEKKTKVIRSIMNNYCQVEKSIVEQLNMKQDESILKNIMKMFHDNGGESADG